MLRQPSSRNYRSKKLRPSHTFQTVLLFAVGIWIVYQLSRSHGKRRALVAEADAGNSMGGGEAATRRRLGRKGFVGFADDASDNDDDIVRVRSDDDIGSQGAGWGAAASDDPSSKAEDREGDGDGEDEDQAADEDDGYDVDADDGLAGDEDNDERDVLLSQNGKSKDELKTLFDESDRDTVFGNGDATGFHAPKELDSSAVPVGKVTGSVQGATASQQTNAADGVADGRASATPLGDSSLKNGSSVNLLLHDRGIAATAVKLVASNGFSVRAARAENEKYIVSVEDNRMINRNETADSVAGLGISS